MLALVKNPQYLQKLCKNQAKSINQHPAMIQTHHFVSVVCTRLIDWLFSLSVHLLVKMLFSVNFFPCPLHANLTITSLHLPMAYIHQLRQHDHPCMYFIKQKKFNAFALFLTKNLLAHLFFLLFVANFSLPPRLLFLLFFPQLQLGLIKNHPIIRLSDSDDSFSNYYLF